VILDIKVRISTKERIMKNGKTICTVCNYIFDEQIGESRQDISPSISFESLPESWKCPECGSGKEMFQPCSCVSLHIYEMSCVTPVSSVAETNANEQRSADLERLLNLPVGNIVAQFPQSACIFEQYGIDYCCGGKKPLEHVLEERNLATDEILQKLSNLSSKKSIASETDWNQASLKELSKHIVEAYHEPLRGELSRLTNLVNKVARVHGINHPEIIEVASIFKTFREELELHMQKEEMILFPGIVMVEAGQTKSFGCGGRIDNPIEVMTREHENVGEALEKFRTLTNNYAPPTDACDTYKVLLHSLANLELLMHEHVHKENNILFPRALSMAGSAAGFAK